MTFYDAQGNAVAYADDDGAIYLFDGRPVAYLHESLVYSFSEKQLGRFEKGWVRDGNGRCVFFTEDASSSGPIKPVKHIEPMRAMKQIKPLESMRQIPRLKPLDSLSWSDISGVEFFQQ